MTQEMLDPFIHAPLIADMPQVCITAGVQPKFLHTSMKEVCGAVEVDWVLNFRENQVDGVPGLLLEGVKNPDTRCQAICAALLRNFIDARTIPVNTVLDSLDKGEMVAPTVLLIPNFYVVTVGTAFQAYKIQALYDLMLARAVQNKPTVVCVEKMEAMKKAYGTPFSDFLSQFRVVKDK